MQKIYFLLRNNKQSGPYSLGQLIAHDLKPYDLIWVEGKTAGWCYPNEIEELESFLSNSNESQQEKEAAKKIMEPNDFLAENSFGAQHIYVSLPSSFTKSIGNENKVLAKTIITPTSSEETEESPDAKLERKAKELKERIQAFSEQKNLPKGDNELDVKYTRSLDDIKNEYSSWLQDQKKKKSTPYQSWVFVSIGTIIFLVSFLGIYFFFRKEPYSITQLTAIAKKETLQISSENIAVNSSYREKTTGKRKVEKKYMPSEMIDSGGALPNKQLDATDRYIDSLRKAERKKQAVAVLHKENDEQSSESNKEVSITNNPFNPGVRNLPSSEVEEQQPPQTKRASENGANTSLDKLIRLSESSYNMQKSLTLHNSSSQALKFVAVDVYYYKANKNLLQKKTIYYQNISPESSVSLPIPEYKNAVSVEYHLGLISSEKGLYYAKQ